MTTIWVLILFLKHGFGAGVTKLEFDTQKQCEDARTELQKMKSYADSKCISKPYITPFSDYSDD